MCHFCGILGFCVHFCRNVDGQPVGKRFFTGVTNSYFISKVKAKLKQISDHYSGMENLQPPSKEPLDQEPPPHDRGEQKTFAHLAGLFAAFHLWLEDTIVSDITLNPSLLHPRFFPDMLVGVMSNTPEQVRWPLLVRISNMPNLKEFYVFDIGLVPEVLVVAVP